MKLNHKLVVAALVGVLAIPGVVGAQTIAYVDARRLIDEAPQGRDEVNQLEQDFSERSRELKGQIEQFNADEAELRKNAVLLSGDELQEKTRLMDDRRNQIRRAQQNYNEDYARARSQSLARLEKLISAVIAELAQEENIDLVVQQAVYASTSIDFTDRVLERLQKTHEQ